MKFFIAFFTFFPTKLFAATNAINSYKNSLANSACKAGLCTTEDNPSRLVGNIINGVLDFLGVAFLILIIYGGIMWMTAVGNEQKVEKAKKIIASSTIGLAIILLSRIITFFIIDIFLPKQ